MLASGKATVALDEEELVELQRIIIDRDDEAALAFLKESIYAKVVSTQQGK